MATLPVTFSCADGQWSAAVTIGGEVTTVPLRPNGNRLQGEAPQADDGSKRTRVDIVNPCPPEEGATTFTAVRGNSGCNFTYFAIKHPDMCNGPRSRGGCADIARFKVELVGCLLDGWQGEGWYCIRAAGSDGPCEAHELLEEDARDNTIEICSGPYTGPAEASFICPRTPPLDGECSLITPPVELDVWYEYSILIGDGEGHAFLQYFLVGPELPITDYKVDVIGSGTTIGLVPTLTATSTFRKDCSRIEEAFVNNSTPIVCMDVPSTEIDHPSPTDRRFYFSIGQGTCPVCPGGTYVFRFKVSAGTCS